MASIACFENPSVGPEVISATGTPGHVTRVHELSEDDAKNYHDTDAGELLIAIQWDNGKTSTFPKWELEAAQVKGER